MVLTKEYRICMPMTVEEYRIGQLYMIARHSFEQSSNGEGVEVVANEQINDETNGVGQFTEKRIHLSSHLPYWIQSLIPKIFYVTEKAWNFYPFTITEYTCSFIPKFSISIQTRYEDNNGSTYNCLGLTPDELEGREVDFLDIAFDEIKPHHYKESEDPKLFKSEKSGRGPLIEGWRDDHKPIMCCYKVVHAKFEVWGLQTKVEDYVQAAIREILLLGHRQAFTWMDEWFNMTIEDVRSYEKEMQTKTNMKVKTALEEAENSQEGQDSKKSSQPPTPKTPKSPLGTPSSESKSWFSWS
ncbi:cytoplasmic phosphatidylinositol transfer protein 1-like [Nymphalis io]|uniref:cytoplasmic phosphatidylinositol transfer protein 1-like n=1 Tax=Inachis io TaxID=171585 RepID=UPI00216991D8|nr:cytoplasmic phosphatidylinositol transfer protein 1-like [Nymphalis io]XP_050357180.1 cytoplasmic phosphatidylinositol transfer protein 1-like [Nymphalis io]